MRSKSYFKQFKEEIKEEKEDFKAHNETSDVPTKRCKHKGKVRMDGNILKCECGAAWGGPNVQALFDLLSKP